MFGLEDRNVLIQSEPGVSTIVDLPWGSLEEPEPERPVPWVRRTSSVRKSPSLASCMIRRLEASVRAFAVKGLCVGLGMVGRRSLLLRLYRVRQPFLQGSKATVVEPSPAPDCDSNRHT